MSIAIKHKSSSTANAVPAGNQLVVREIAVNVADGKLFAKLSSGAVVTFSNDDNSPNRVLFSSGAPGAGEGFNGNLYLDTAAKDLYYKTGGAWGLVVNLGGENGAHTHAAGDIISGLLNTARLGTGEADTTKYLRGDSTWAVVPTVDYFPPSGVTISGDQSVVAGTDLILVCAVAQGGTPYTYQWKRNGANVGTNSETLTIQNAEIAAHSGDYTCLVSNSDGSELSNTLPVVVQEAPVITSETPPDETPVLNAVIDFAITATGTSISYVWQYSTDGESYAPMTASGLTTNVDEPIMSTQATVAHQGYYRCRVFNAVGEVFSSPMVIVMTPPEIVTQPDPVGGEGTTAVAAIGVGTLTYQWLYGGVNISTSGSSGADTDVLNVAVCVADSLIDLNRGYQFSCRVSNQYGSVTSVSVSSRPFLFGATTGQGVTRASGNAVVLVAGIVGPPGTTYAWTKNGLACGCDVDVFGDTIPRLTIKEPQMGDEGTYVCRGTNAIGYVEAVEISVDMTDNATVHKFPRTIPEVRVFDDETLELELVALMPVIEQGCGYFGCRYTYPINYRVDGAIVPAIAGVNDYTLKQGAFVRRSEFTADPNTNTVGVSDAEFKSRTVVLNGATMPVEAYWQFLLRSQYTEVIPESNPTAGYPTTNAPWVAVVNSSIAAHIYANDAPLCAFMAYVISKAVITSLTEGPLVFVLGDDLSISVVATGSNLLYAWYRDDVRCPLQSGPNFSKVAAQDDAGIYRCKVGNESYMTQHCVTSGECVVDVIGILATPESGNYCTEDTVTVQFCGTPGDVEFALVVDGVVGAYQDSEEVAIGDNFGVPLKLRIRHKTQTDKWHESGVFTATQIFKWKVTFCGLRLDNNQPAQTNGHVTLGQVFANGGFVDVNSLNGDTDYYLPTATSVGQTHNHQVNTSYGTLCVMPHDIVCTSI